MTMEPVKAQLKRIKQFTFKQFLPSKEDLECKEAKELSKRLMGVSYKETLTNFLEWQEKNIRYWDERADMFIFISLLSIIPLWFIYMLSYLWTILFTAIFLIFFLNFMLFLFLALILMIEAIIILSYAAMYVSNASIIVYIVALSTVFGGIVSLLLYTRIKYRYFKTAHPEFRLRDTFKTSLSVKEILRYRLAVCKDYAKISATLLSISYPQNKIYFLTFPSHAAAGIKIGDKIYVLDQRLPVLTVERWIDNWSRRMSGKIWFMTQSLFFRILRRGEVSVFEMFVDDAGNVKVKESARMRLSRVTDVPRVNIESLTRKLVDEIKLGQDIDENAFSFEVKLEDFAVYYEDNEIVEFSMLRAINNRLDKELCGQFERICGIELNQRGVDLIAKVYIRR